MKILIDASVCSIGGGVQVALAVINNIAQDPTFDVICVTSPQVDMQLSPEIKAKITYYYPEVNENIFGKRKQGKRLSAIEEKYKPDLVFVIFGPAYWKPKSKSIQGFALGKMLYQQELAIGGLEKILYQIKKFYFKKSASYLLVETDLVKQKLVAFLKYPSDKIFVIGNSYSPLFEKYIINNQNNIEHKLEDFTILVPGSYYQHKNLERVIKALSIVKNNYPNVKALFTIPPDSEGWRKLTALAQEYDVLNVIDTAGFVENSEFARLYLESNAVICASLVESSTAVFPETFLAMLPLLVSNRTFATELCENAALYFDALEVESIANAIMNLVSNKELQLQLIERGTEVLKKNYPSAEAKWLMQKSLIVKLINERT